MRGITGYISLITILALALILTIHFINYIDKIYDNAVRIVSSSGDRVYSVRYLNDTKIVIIEKNSSEPIVRGNYTVVANTTEELIIQAGINEEITVITNDDIIKI